MTDDDEADTTDVRGESHGIRETELAGVKPT